MQLNALTAPPIVRVAAVFRTDMPRSARCIPFLDCVGTFVALMLASAHSLAVPINYTETRSGDLSFTVPAFVLDAGNNTISGTTHVSVNSPGLPRFDTDFDDFAFQIPTGLQLVGLSLSFLTTAFNANGANLELRLCVDIGACESGPAELLGTEKVDLLGTSPMAIDFALALPLSAGTFSIFTSGLGIAVANTNIAQASWFSDYTWTLAVQSVSEPNALGLLALGFAGLLWIRRPKIAAIQYRVSRTPLSKARSMSAASFSRLS